ncbi:MAG: septal ring lytic transglycosylase RlpA family protein [Candidatus Micrarchaeia archaeon]
MKSKIFFILFFSLAYLYCEEYGLASWYGGGEPLNYYTANGEVFSPYKFTCATRNYPFGTLLRVVNIRNGKDVIVRVNDRGPADWLPSRIIDLTKTAFEQIEDLEKGLTFVRVEVLKTPQEQENNRQDIELSYDFSKEISQEVKKEIQNMFKEIKQVMKEVRRNDT